MIDEQPGTDPTSTRSTPVLVMVVVASGLVLAALPLFMVGGLAVQIKDELGFSETALGAAVTIGFVVGALSAPFGGRLADHIGPKRALYLGSSLSAMSMLGLGLLGRGWGETVGFLSLAGLAVAITDPGLAILVNRAIPLRRQGLAFGIKEASIPASTLAAGIAVPLIALTAGWRWAFAIGLVPWLMVMVLVARVTAPATRANAPASSVPTDVSPPPRRALVLAAVAAGLGTTAASGVGIFLTDSAVTMGFSPGDAGLLLALGSVAGIATRVLTGVVADRTGGPQFRLIAAMLAIGALTMALGGTGNTALLILGAVGAFTGGWAWTGLFFLSLVKTHPDRPGAVAGIGTAGLGLGNAAGPLLFGVVAQTYSFGAAWLGAAIVAAIAAGMMALAHRRF